jgi:outer membrane protein OmpA-like peptidoglycan-associated protein
MEAVRTANDKAASALAALGTSGVAAPALVDAMNLAIINFPSGSAEIPSDSLNVIRTSAEAIKRAPAGTKIEIAGHTDNTGDAASNMRLSQARSDAVKNAFVAAGVNAGMLTTVGYGDNKPRATNETEYGRFQNRRIEYALR